MPEYRDDKSPFFREMETALLQNEITEDNVEQALLDLSGKTGRDRETQRSRYVLAKPEPQDNEDSSEIFRVCGRIFNNPHIYHYPQFDARNEVWTNLEKVNLDIV